MTPLAHTYEARLRRRGFVHIAGVDEAGRGALAGPLVAGAVIMPDNADIPEVQDSKILTEAVREALYDMITAKATAWAVAIVSERIIDQRGVQHANLSALSGAVANLKTQPHYVLVDGYAASFPYPSERIIHGDRDIFSIACASIIAKVTRDRLMRDLEETYPHYTFATHKGYGTKQHRKEIHQHGLSDIHRTTFRIKKWK